ncbi:IS6 family transposase [Bacillus thuringiensis]|uniref:DDE-type integrase/transposase/recombinase n=1 Tax=Bacillus thuringiensis TaxID=1428 RepID=UPI003338340A
MRYFKGKQFKKDIILVAVGYYCRFALSYRDVSKILKERGVSVHPTTIMRWVHEYGSLIYQIWKKKNKTAPALLCALKKLKNNGFYVHTKHCTVKHLNNLIKQDHRHVKRRFAKSAGFQTLRHASRTLKGIETIHAIYKKKRSHILI